MFPPPNFDTVSTSALRFADHQLQLKTHVLGFLKTYSDGSNKARRGGRVPSSLAPLTREAPEGRSALQGFAGFGGLCRSRPQIAGSNLILKCSPSSEDSAASFRRSRKSVLLFCKHAFLTRASISRSYPRLSEQCLHVSK